MATNTKDPVIQSWLNYATRKATPEQLERLKQLAEAANGSLLLRYSLGNEADDAYEPIVAHCGRDNIWVLKTPGTPRMSDADVRNALASMNNDEVGAMLRDLALTPSEVKTIVAGLDPADVARFENFTTGGVSDSIKRIYAEWRRNPQMSIGERLSAALRNRTLSPEEFDGLVRQFKESPDLTFEERVNLKAKKQAPTPAEINTVKTAPSPEMIERIRKHLTMDNKGYGGNVSLAISHGAIEKGRDFFGQDAAIVNDGDREQGTVHPWDLASRSSLKFTSNAAEGEFATIMDTITAGDVDLAASLTFDHFTRLEQEKEFTSMLLKLLQKGEFSKPTLELSLALTGGVGFGLFEGKVNPAIIRSLASADELKAHDNNLAEVLKNFSAGKKTLFAIGSSCAAFLSEFGDSYLALMAMAGASDEQIKFWETTLKAALGGFISTLATIPATGLGTADMKAKVARAMLGFFATMPATLLQYLGAVSSVPIEIRDQRTGYLGVLHELQQSGFLAKSEHGREREEITAMVERMMIRSPDSHVALTSISVGFVVAAGLWALGESGPLGWTGHEIPEETMRSLRTFVLQPWEALGMNLDTLSGKPWVANIVNSVLPKGTVKSDKDKANDRTALIINKRANDTTPTAEENARIDRSHWAIGGLRATDALATGFNFVRNRQSDHSKIPFDHLNEAEFFVPADLPEHETT